jgi:xanthine dehydrogenase accessory factor
MHASSAGRRLRGFAVILGTNEIASAIAVQLHQQGYFTVLSHDPYPPVIRRRMAFHDALFDEAIMLDNVSAQRADGLRDLLLLRQQAQQVAITEMGLTDLLVLQTPDLLIDARMQKYHITPDLRHLARLTIGLGPSFIAGQNCDLAIETRPDKRGRIVPHGATERPDGTPRSLGGRGEERFVRAGFAGRWHTPLEIGTRIFKDFSIGFLDNIPVQAPFDGVLRGVVRDGQEVQPGVKLLEIDPRGRNAVWWGVEEHALNIAHAVLKILILHASRIRAGGGLSTTHQ